MSEANRIETTDGVAGSEAPNQPIYEGFQQNEPEAPPEGQPEQAASEGYEVPDKFMREDGSVDVEALARSYSELERGQSQEETAPNEEVSDETMGEALSDENMLRYSNEVFGEGNLSEESYSSLESAGYNRGLVEKYVQLIQLEAEVLSEKVLEPVGGQEAYDELTKWAGENLPDAELATYNSVMNTNDPAQIDLAIKGIYARYQNGSVTKPNLIAGDTGGATASSAFRSWSEVTKAMRHSDYQNDPAYRQDVLDRLNVSHLNG